MVDVHSVPDAGIAPPVPPDPPRSDARTAFEQGDYERAAALFRAEAATKPELLYDVGRSLELAGHKAEAATVYEEYVRRNDLTPMDKMSMELRIKLLRTPP